MEAELRKEGWSLSDKGLEYCKSLSTNKDPSRREIITNALHTDLRQIGKQCLPADINRAKNTMIEGPIVLQIQKIRNVSAPNAKEDSSFAPRMLKLSMTDGVMSCTGLELETVNAISLLTPSGSKICLTGKLAVHNGFILLTERNVKLIGGNVDHLKAKWELSSNVNKLQRKVLAADGGPPLFVPFENSEFSRRKPPTASSTTKTSEPKQPPNRERPAMQTEKVTKPFEDKKIWKSDPLKAKKDKSSKFGKDTFSDRSQDQKGAGEKGDRRSNTNTEGRKSTEKEKQQDRYQQGKNLKVGSKKVEEETSRHAAQNSKKDSIKNAQKEDRMAVKDQGEEVKNSEKQKYRNGGKSEFEEKKLWNKQERNVRSRQETTRPKSGGREEKPGNNFQDLPPRMERLKQQKSSDVKEDRNKVSETRKEGKTGEKNSKNAKIDAKEIEDKEISGKPDDKDMERVIGLLNEKMRMDEGRSAGMGDDRQKRSRYENTRYVDRSRGQVETEHKKYGKEEASRSTMDHSAPAKYEQRNGERLGQRGQGRGRYGGQGRGSQRGGFSYRNGRYDSGGYDPSHGDARKNQMKSIDGEGVRGLEANVRSGNFGRNPGQSENGNNGLMRENSGQVTNLEAEKPDKVAQFMSAVVANSGKGMQGDLMANMQRQAFGNQNIAQQSVPQAMVTSSDSMMYNYLTTYPTAMFQPSANQPYHPMHSQNFQRGGYQGNMQSLSAMNQYQQMPPVSQMPPMSQMAPMSQVPPMPAMYYQGMGPPQQNMGFRGQPPGFGARGKPRVKHDVYRPKTE